MVPLQKDYLTLDYVKDQKLPVIVVTNGQLGSINHTLLTLATLKTHGIEIYAVVYNPYFDEDEIICADTVEYLKKWVADKFSSSKFMVMPKKI